MTAQKSQKIKISIPAKKVAAGPAAMLPKPKAVSKGLSSFFS
jgi:hypothetical protein